MYFPTSNHYFDKLELLYQDEVNDEVEDEDNECLICLEIIDKTNSICIKIQNIFYNKDCLCDGWIHQYCLDIWYAQNKKCPICLCIMTENEIHDKVIIYHDIVIRNINTTFCLFTRYFCYVFIFLNIIFLLDKVLQFIILYK